MNCGDFEADLVELARCSPGEPGTAPGLRRHLETCRACADRLARERALTGGLRSLAEETVAPENPDMERRLLEAFASAHPSSGAAEPARPTTAWWMLAAAATVVLLLGSWSAVEWPRGDGGGTVATAAPTPVAGRPDLDAPRSAASADRPAEPAGPVRAATATPASAVSRSRDRPGRPPLPRGTRPTTAPASDTDELAGFVALPAADHLPGFDSGTIVRVAFPAASLPAFGFPMAPDAARTVDADVLVGQDGQARAIRLVSLKSRSRREPR